ncbi:ankyrin repeat domain-containing protein [Deefgea piscis]|uniref:ankyrin repeat domain-containing protein n=1 Tax=Deefgea piscis TaxID=2739061 RepID=UPI001C7FB139|nr:ankyrin repeat domain-containing protein [Deefgea piscis]QZA81996.1 ankyrin repeat domain-containing protein [Deefgea piscis]
MQSKMKWWAFFAVTLTIVFGAWLAIKPSKEYELLIAIQSKNKIAAKKMLLSGDIDMNAKLGGDKRTFLHAAVEQHDFETLKLLLKLGAVVDATNSHNETPLYIAAYQQDTNMVSLLLNNGANPNFADSEYGYYPLFFTVKNQNTAASSILLRHGASPCIQTKSGLTAYSLAVQKNLNELAAEMPTCK